MTDDEYEYVLEFIERMRKLKTGITGNMMDEVIEEKTFFLDDWNKFRVTILFTERQYNLWKNKGGEKWLKKALVGQKFRK